MKQAVEEKLLTLAETAQRLGVSVKTLRRWDKTGEFPAIRTPTGHRRYLQSEVDKRLGIQRTQASALPVATYWAAYWLDYLSFLATFMGVDNVLSTLQPLLIRSVMVLALIPVSSSHSSVVLDTPFNVKITLFLLLKACSCGANHKNE